MSLLSAGVEIVFFGIRYIFALSWLEKPLSKILKCWISSLHMNLEFPVNWPHDHYENAQIKSFLKKTNRKRERETERDREKRERRERESFYNNLNMTDLGLTRDSNLDSNMNVLSCWSMTTTSKNIAEI